MLAIPACLIFEDEPYTIPPAHCYNNIIDAGETGIDCGDVCSNNCPPPTCNDGFLNGNEQGIDCGGFCSLVCYTTPTCNAPLNQLQTDLGIFNFGIGGLPNSSSLIDYDASASTSGTGPPYLVMVLNNLGNYAVSQTVVDDNVADQANEIALSLNVSIDGTTNYLRYNVVGEIPFEYNEAEQYFILHFCQNPSVPSNSSITTSLGNLTGKIKFRS